MNTTRRLLATYAAGLALATAFALPAEAATAQSTTTPGSAAAAAVPTGPLAIEPQGGTDQTAEVRLVTAQVCPKEADHYLVQIEGAGFKRGSNAIGNSVVSNLMATNDGKGLVVPLWGTWQMIADVNEVKDPLDGTAKLTMLCIEKFGRTIYAANVGEVKFTKKSKAPSGYQQAGGPRLSSGQPRTPEEAAAAERKDGSFPLPNEGAVTIDSAPAPTFVAQPTTGSSSDVGTITDSSDVRSAPTESSQPGPAEDTSSTLDSAPTARSSDGGGVPTTPLIALVLLVAAAGAGVLGYRATRPR